MIVVAVIAILAAIALPRYQDYTTCARVTTMLAELAGGKVGVESLMMEGALGPAIGPAEVGLQSPAELEGQQGIITSRAKNCPCA